MADIVEHLEGLAEHMERQRRTVAVEIILRAAETIKELRAVDPAPDPAAPTSFVNAIESDASMLERLLRAEANRLERPVTNHAAVDLMRDAADEIERLRGDPIGYEVRSKEGHRYWDSSTAEPLSNARALEIAFDRVDRLNDVNPDRAPFSVHPVGPPITEEQI